MNNAENLVQIFRRKVMNHAISFFSAPIVTSVQYKIMHSGPDSAPDENHERNISTPPSSLSNPNRFLVSWIGNTTLLE